MDSAKKEAKRQFEILTRLAVETIPEEELLEKLEKSIATGRPLTVKLGCDPSRPDLHIGHAVVLRVLRNFQDLGHDAVLVVGDFTAMIGDPSGRSKTRPSLTFEETRENGKTYLEQAARIIDPDKTRIVYNSEWLEKLDFSEVIELASSYTVARMLERDDFEKRYSAGEPIGIHEFLYPLAQAMDSVALTADVELGGTDQKFNLLVGRDLQRQRGQDPQVIMTSPLLEGTDGDLKMSKSHDNQVAITDGPVEMFGKLMSIPDRLIAKYFRLAAFAPTEEVEKAEKALSAGSVNPMELKKDMAEAVVKLYHTEEDAASARGEFERVFSERELPEDIPEASYAAGEEIWIVNLIRNNGLASSGGEARRLIKQGAVSIDGERIEEIGYQHEILKESVLKVGKRRYLRILPE